MSTNSEHLLPPPIASLVSVFEYRGMLKTKISVFEYTDAAEYLKVVFERKKKERPSYSIRAWSRALKAGHVTALARALSGQGRVPKSMIPAFIKNLEMSAQEGAYFEILVLGGPDLRPESLSLIQKLIK